MGDSGLRQGLDPSVDESILPVWSPGSVPISRLLEVVLLLNNTLTKLPRHDTQRSWEPLSVTCVIKLRGKVINLFIPVDKVHVTIIAIVVMSALGGINRKQHIVGAKAVAVSVGVGKDSSLEHLIIGEVYSGDNMRRVHRQHLILRKEIINILVQHHSPHRLQRNQLFRPDLGRVQRVKIEPVLVIRVHHLNIKLPLRVIPGGDGLV
nr:Uncharacterised protein [Ipomoea batatas]GMD10932.1 Uncharacterised protein [Ipomoea batatas]